jgi:hypothetical protein
MRIRWITLVPLLALVLGTATTARAEYLDWSYSWSMDPPSITSKLSGVTASTISAWTTPGTVVPVQVATLTTFTSGAGPGTTLNDFKIPTTAYNLTLSLTDNEIPGMTPVQLHLSGLLWGIVSPTQVHLFQKVTSATDSVVIGSHLYTVHINNFKTPTMNSDHVVTSGGITAQITVSNKPPLTRTPEPASLLLAGAVFPMVLWYRGRRPTPAAKTA